MKTLQIKRILVFVLALASSSYGVAQLNSKAIQRSAIVKSTPYECQGYVLFHPTPRVVQWNAIATIEDQNLFILPTEVTSIVGFDHLRLPKSVWGNPDFSYKIQGLGIDGKVVVEEDHTPPADPNNNSHYLNNCNRPTCNAETYAYSILVYSHLDEALTNYYLKLGNAWNGYTEAGIQIPYYQRVPAANLQTYIDERNLYDNGFDYYQDPDYGNFYYVKKDRGPWKNVYAITGELVSNEECFLTYSIAEQVLNDYGDFSSTNGVECNGQAISSNEPSGGTSDDGGTPQISDYADFIDCMWDASFGDNDFTLLDLWECWDNATEPTNGGPCPEGYYYSPGGGDPCVLMEDIIIHPLDLYGQEPASAETFTLKDKIVRKKPGRSAINNHVFPKGLYSIAVKLDNGLYIPFLKSFEADFTLLSEPVKDVKLQQQHFAVYPNPMSSGTAFTIEAVLESDYLYSYTIADSKDGGVLAEGQVAYDAAVQCTINSGSSKPVNAFIQFISNDPSISGEATKHVLIRP